VDGGTVIALGVEGADRGTGPGRAWAATRRAGTWSGKIYLDAPRVVGPTGLRDVAVADDGGGRVVVAWVAGAGVHVAQFFRGAWAHRIVGSQRTVGARGVSVHVNTIGDIAVAWSGARGPGQEMKAYVAFAHRRGPTFLQAFAIGRRLPRAGRPPSVFVGDTGAIVATWTCGAYLCARDLSPESVRDRFAGSTRWGPLRRTRDVVRPEFSRSAPTTSFLTDAATVVVWRDQAGVARWTRRPFGGEWSAGRAYATGVGGAGLAMSPFGDGLLLSAASGVVVGRRVVGGVFGPSRRILSHPGVGAVEGHHDAVGATLVLGTGFFGSTGRTMRTAVRWQDRPQPSRLRVHRSGAVTFDMRFGGGPYEIRVIRPGVVRPRLIRLGVGRPGANTTRLPLRGGDVVVVDTGHGYLGRARARVG
jgi:hypothetical protein